MFFSAGGTHVIISDPHGLHLFVLFTCKHFSLGLKFLMPLGSIKSAACDEIVRVGI